MKLYHVLKLQTHTATTELSQCCFNESEEKTDAYIFIKVIHYNRLD